MKYSNFLMSLMLMVVLAFSWSLPSPVVTLEIPHHLYIIKNNTVIDKYAVAEIDSIAVVKTHSSHSLRFFEDGVELASYDVNSDIDSIIFENSLAGEFQDSISGEKYSWVQIGSTKWLSKNLDYLPSVRTVSETSSIANRYHVYDYYGNSTTEAKESANYITYGTLYNWQSALDACPNGWRLPTKTEWEDLVEIAQGEKSASKMLRQDYTWNDSSKVNNFMGFSALAGGYLNSNFDFDQINSQAYWWSSTKTADSVYYFNLSKDLAVVSATDREFLGHSVRCVEGDVIRHKVSVGVQGKGSIGVTTSAKNGDRHYPQHKVISISAYPNDSLTRFSHWSGDVHLLEDSTLNPLSFSMPDAPVNLVANFAPNLKITIEANPAGAATFTGGDGIYGPGDTVSIRTTVDPNYRFLGLAANSAIVDANNAYTRVIMPDSNLKITANFTQAYQLNLTADLAAGGTVTGSGKYAANAAVNIGVSVKSNHKFIYWTGPGAMYLDDSTKASASLKMPSNEVNITAKIVALSGTVTDSRDGNKYNWKLIGEYQWFTENLAYLPNKVHKPTDTSYSQARYYVYGYNGTNVSTAKNNANYEKYGVLYNNMAAFSLHGDNCPTGWDPASSESWDNIMAAYTDVRDFKSTTGWPEEYFVGAPGNGTNKSGFNAKPGGVLNGSHQKFEKEGHTGYWWIDSAWPPDRPTVGWSYNFVERINKHDEARTHGLSVRCVKRAYTPPK